MLTNLRRRFVNTSYNAAVGAINRNVLDDLRSLQTPGAPSLLGELIDGFLSGAAGQLQKLREAVASKDAALLERAGHALKGSCGNLGAQAMSRICADLLNVGHGTDWTRAAGVLPGLEAEWTAVKAELEAERRTL